MSFVLPRYQQPDFSLPLFAQAPDAHLEPAPLDGVAPEHFHATSIYPEYYRIQGRWLLAEESRMDCCVVLRPDGHLEVVEPRRLCKGDLVVTGRTENAEEGIYLHAHCFEQPDSRQAETFSFRSGRSRETAFSRDYDQLYQLLRHEKEHGNVLWVMGPAFSFDADARRSMQRLVEQGYVQGLLAGNALATHDLEAAHLGTALGQDIYTQQSQPLGHYNHLEVINRVRRCGSIPAFIEEYGIDNGILYSLVKKDIPFVLTGSIRDDGPLPEVIGDAYEGQNAMRRLVRRATTVICLATQLHTIATGNMTPCFRKTGEGIRPLYIYTVDISEFVVNKLRDRGSLSAVSFVTNAQDFIVNLANNLCE